MKQSRGPSRPLQLCSSFNRIVPRPSACLMIGSRRLPWSSKTRSVLRCGKRQDKKATASGPCRGMIRSWSLNQEWMARVSRSTTFDALSPVFSPFRSSSLSRWHSRPNLKHRKIARSKLAGGEEPDIFKDRVGSGIVLAQDNYTVKWACAFPSEMAAARGMLDEIHEGRPHGQMLRGMRANWKWTAV
jgi:hypothetical protein